MNTSICLEAYLSDKALRPMKFYHYQLVVENPSQEVDLLKLVRSAARRLNNTYAKDYFAVTDDKDIYTLFSIDEERLKFTVTYNKYKFRIKLIFQKQQEVEPISKIGRIIYKELIPLVLYQKLSQVKQQGKVKYRILNNQLMQTPWILLSDGSYKKIKSKDGSLQLYREFHFRVEILDTGFFLLYIDNAASFETGKTVCQLARDAKYKKILAGKRARYILPVNYNQVGTIEFIPQEPGNFTNRKGLLNYYKTNDDLKDNPMVIWARDHSPLDDFALCLHMKNGQKCNYLASVIKLVFDMETVKQWDASFMKRNNQYIKVAMPQRIAIDQSVLRDIGKLKLLQNIGLNFLPIKAEDQHFHVKLLSDVYLVGGNRQSFKGEPNYKKAVFDINTGFYRKPDLKEVKIGFISLDSRIHKRELSYIGYFLMQHKKFRKLLSPIDIENFTEQVEFHDETELKEVIYKLKEKKQPYFCFVVASNLALWHDLIKSFFIQKRYGNICTHTQLIDVSHAVILAAAGLMYYKIDNQPTINPMEIARIKQEIKTKCYSEFNRLDPDEADYYVPALLLGAFAKMGGIPFRLKENLGGESTFFMGLDVSTERKGVHYPSCSIVYNGCGEYIGGYQPQKSQIGEIISTENLHKIFDDVVLPYKIKHGSYPKHIIVHRDGRTRAEELEWYKNYCQEKNIELDVVDVIKSGVPRLCCESAFANPAMGTCIYQENQAILVSTTPYRGAPRPLRIVHIYGTTTMKELVRQIYSLTKLSCSSLHNRRLPVTTGDADKMCKASDYMIQGEIFETLDYL